VAPAGVTDLLASPLPFHPDDDGRRMLATLQANILHAHVRTHLHVLALRIEGPYAARHGLSYIARQMKTADRHLHELRSHRRGAGGSGSAYVGIALSARGYERLHVPLDRWPADPAFREGLGRRNLGDPGPEHLEEPYRDGIDVLVMVGSHDEEHVTAKVREVLAELGSSVSVLAEEVGRTLRNANGDGIEHFGYVDGRSQPLFTEEDLANEQANGGADRWNPLVSLGHVLVPDPGAPGCYGSYLVYRKLEQDVRAFKEQELQVAAALGLTGADEERAGALLVGRYEDGTPLALSPGDGMRPVPNDFTFADDPDGARCPFASHMRLMSDRPAAGEPRTVLARRGVSYGVRADNPNDDDLASKPRRGVGLLFLALMADVEGQFERLQHLANGDGDGPFDAVAGQRRVHGRGDPVALPRTYGEAGGDADVPLEPVVLHRGGEYLFVPSVEFLVRLGAG
jgi:Dyp-type peroxidase family